MDKIARYLKISAKEYVIWGVPEGDNMETLLMDKFENKLITDINTAKKLKEILETKYKAKKVRIQTLDITKPFDWLKETDLK